MGRYRIPADITADVLFLSDNTCCICRERGKSVQIHHIDENPSNNEIQNLAVLCLECHNSTQLTGGFGRSLTDKVIIKYRNDWIDRVRQRRDTADKIAVERLSVPSENIIKAIDDHRDFLKRRDVPLEYINSLPERRKELRRIAQPEWDSGVTSRMVQASYNYIDALQAILTTLANYYPEGHFDSMDLHRFFSEQISSRFKWHRSHVDLGWPGSRGTIINVICSGNVVGDVEKMVEDMVMSLVAYDDEFDWKGWPIRWKAPI